MKDQLVVSNTPWDASCRNTLAASQVETPSTPRWFSPPSLLLPPVATFPRTDHWRYDALHYILHSITFCNVADWSPLHCTTLNCISYCTAGHWFVELVTLRIPLCLRMCVVQRPLHFRFNSITILQYIRFRLHSITLHNTKLHYNTYCTVALNCTLLENAR